MYSEVYCRNSNKVRNDKQGEKGQSKRKLNAAKIQANQAKERHRYMQHEVGAGVGGGTRTVRLRLGADIHV